MTGLDRALAAVRIFRNACFFGIAALLMAAAACAGGSGEATTAAPTPTEAPSPTAAADTARDGVPGVTGDSVLFGQSAAFSGPAQALGTNMCLGIEAAFAEVNRNGGAHGRQLRLTSLDDTYEPEAAAINTRKLIEEQSVFALIGEVGTPTSRSATPVAAGAGVPFVAPFTGAAFLRDTGQFENIINLRASYNDETEAMVERFTTDLGLKRIAVLYQDDSFGRAGYNGSLAALKRRGMQPVSVGLYPRNTTAVKTALLDLAKGKPEGIIMVGAYEPIGAFIQWARLTNLVDAHFIVISFVGSNALAEMLGPDGQGVYVTQVVPFPTDDSIPVVASYLDALAEVDPGLCAIAGFTPRADPGFVSFEGYLAGRLAIAGLEFCGREVTRECFVDNILNSGVLDLDGFMLNYAGAADNQGSDTVFLTVIGPDGKYKPIETLQDALN